jgi:hypothetical protein
VKLCYHPKGREQGIEVRGPSHHAMDSALNFARDKLQRWTAAKN